MKNPSIVWIVVENALVVIIAFSLFLVATTSFESVVLSLLILVYAEVRRSRLHSVEAFLHGNKQYVHLLKVAETTFHEQAKQKARLAKAIKDPQLTVNDIPDHENSLDLLRSFEEVEFVEKKEHRKVGIAILIEEVFLVILCLLALWKILKSIIWLT